MMNIKIKCLLCVSLIFFILISSINGQSARKLNRDAIEHYKEGEFSKAEKGFKNALKKDEKLLEATYNLGLAYYKNKDYGKAIAQYKIVINKTSDKATLSKTHHNMGNSYLQAGKLQEAIEAYKNALLLNPKDEETRYNLVYALQKQKARNKDSPKNPTVKNLLDQIEQEDENAQQFMRRNKNLGKEVKNW